MNKHSAMDKNKNVKNNKTIRTKHWVKESCLQCLQQKNKYNTWKLKDGEQWKGSYITEHHVKEVKVSTILYSISHFF